MFEWCSATVRRPGRAQSSFTSASVWRQGLHQVSEKEVESDEKNQIEARNQERQSTGSEVLDDEEARDDRNQCEKAE